MVLTKMHEHGLGLNRKKCAFNLREIDFLGIRVLDGRIQPTKERLHGLLSFPLPQDLKSFERFVGMATYFSKFVDHFSDVVNPLLELKRTFWKEVTDVPVPKLTFGPKSRRKVSTV